MSKRKRDKSKQPFFWGQLTHDGKNGDQRVSVEIEDWSDDLLSVRVDDETIFLLPNEAREMSNALAAAADAMDAMHGGGDDD